jgi:hypothetical protein
MNIFGFDYVEATQMIVAGFAYGLVFGFILGVLRFILFTGVERHEA